MYIASASRFAGDASEPGVQIGVATDSESGEGEVVSHGIAWAKFGVAGGDFEGGGEVGLVSGGEAELFCDVEHVGVERDDELAWADLGPASGVDVVGANHPAHVHVESLAGGALVGAGDQAVRVWGDGLREGGQGGDDGVVASSIML